MKMPLRSIVPLLVFGLAACDVGTPAEPDAARLGPSGSNHSTLEQSLVDDLAAGVDYGAILDRDVGCAILSGFSSPAGLAAFGGLFPTPGPRGICPTGNFERTNPDGTTDLHMQGRGGFFLVVFDPFTIFPSEGSHVRWRAVFHQDGSSTFNFSGTLSDGSMVRGHFAVTPRGRITAGNTLWVEGLGYIIGGPSGS